MVIALLTDFGHKDHYVGVIKGVIWTICPEAQLLDLCHEVPPQDLVGGAYLLSTSQEYLPDGAITVAVIDPGVGGPRRAIAARAGERLWVGPDNGLFSLLFERTPPTEVVALEEPTYRLDPVSATFHGRDIFAPAAAHLAAGVELDELGPELDPDELVGLEDLTPHREGDDIVGRVLHLDHFGNVITNITREACEVWRAGAPLEVEIADEEFPLVRTFTDVEPGQILAYYGSGGLLEIAVREGSAARRLDLSQGARLRVRALVPREED